MKPSCAVFLLLAVVTTLVASGVHAEAWTRIAGSGDPVPGDPDRIFTALVPIGVADDGTVWISAATQVPTDWFSQRSGYWKWSAATGLIAFPPYPAGPNVVSPSAGPPPTRRLATDGALALIDEERLLRCTLGELECAIVAQDEDPAPGIPGAVLQRFVSAAPLTGSAIVFTAEVRNADLSVSAGVFVGESTNTMLVAASGDPIAGVPEATLGPQLDQGAACGDGLLFRSVTPGPSIGDPPVERLLRWSSTRGLEAVFASTDPVPGRPVTAQVGLLRGAQESSRLFECNHDGTVALATKEIDSADPRATVASHLHWTCAVGEPCALRASAGDPIPDRPGSFFLWSFSGAPSDPFDRYTIDAGDAFAFDSYVESSGSYSVGLFESSPLETPATRVIAGEPVPDAGEDVVFSAIRLIAMNGRRLIFAAHEGPLAGPPERTGIYVDEPDGSRFPVLRVGVVEYIGNVLPPPYRAVTDSAGRFVAARITTGPNGMPREELVFATVPEPQRVLAIAAACGAFAILRRAKRRSRSR